MLLDLAGRRLKCVRARAHTHTHVFLTCSWLTLQIRRPTIKHSVKGIPWDPALADSASPCLLRAS
jgi:hypothetical protein